MAQTWENNDSAREMTRKYNNAVTELNRVAALALGINKAYLAAVPSGFVIDDEGGADDGA